MKDYTLYIILSYGITAVIMTVLAFTTLRPWRKMRRERDEKNT